MNGKNLAFITNPKVFLETNAVVCYGIKAAAQKADINRIDGNTLAVGQEFAPSIDFDFVPNPLGYCDLKMLGAAGTYATTSRSGRPVVGNYIPYLGQTDVESSARFGRINLSQVTTDYVFTFTFSGCNFVVTKAGGDTIVYHEPTAAAWTASDASRYPGEVFQARIGPPYDDTHDSGWGCLVRDKMTRSKWIAYCQMPDGIKMSKARLYQTVIQL